MNEANIKLIKKLIKAKIRTEEDLNNFKREISKSSGDNPMSNRHLSMAYLNFTKNKRNKKDANLLSLLKTKKMRSLSGVAIITISTKPYPCPGNCLYCPTEKAMPKSYLSNEPAIMRAILNKFDPYKQTFNRIKDLKLSEISLVDRPANPDAVFAMVKIDDKGKVIDNVHVLVTFSVEVF